MKKKYTFFNVLLRLMPMQFKAAPGPTLINSALGFIHSLTWAGGIIATQGLFDAITGTGQLSFWNCLIPLLILAGVTFAQQIMNGISNFYYHILEMKTTGKIKTLLHRKLTRLDPAYFEDTAFLDDLNKANEGIKVIPHFAVTYSLIVFFYGVYFAAIGTYLFHLKPILLITLLISFFPALLAQIVRGKVFTKLEEQSAPLRREYEYYQNTLCDREYFKETRSLGVFKFFHMLFSQTMLLLTRKTWQAERKTALIQLLLNTTSFAGLAASSYLLFTATMSGEISVGAFAAVFAALRTVFYLMQEIITMHIGAMNRSIGKLVNFIRVLDMSERTGVDGKLDFNQGIVAENISFSYPGREEMAVKAVSLKIPDGKTIAIVGENGAGKTTLVRLLTGLYRPSGGKVIVGGLDTAETSPASVYKGISGVFQNYQRYKMTLKENIFLSKTEDIPDTSRVENVLKEAGVETELGLDNMLSPEFDGIDLSGGQWQRISIARGLYRVNRFIVLDEPTAAIDPIEETRIYTQFQRLAQGKCSLIVTHRLGSAKLAHKIIVMEKGEIVDTGTHEELLSRPGKYAEMWKAQAQWYQRVDNF